MKTVTAKDVLNIADMTEMAKVGSYTFKNDQFEVWVYTEPLKNPSFHFRNKTDGYEVVLTMADLSELEWKTKKQKIPIQHLRSLVAWFKAPHEKNTRITNWDALAIAWDALNHQSPLSTHDMPDLDAILTGKR